VILESISLDSGHRFRKANLEQTPGILDAGGIGVVPIVLPRLGFSWQRGNFSGPLFRENWHVWGYASSPRRLGWRAAKPPLFQVIFQGALEPQIDDLLLIPEGRERENLQGLEISFYTIQEMAGRIHPAARRPTNARRLSPHEYLSES
jgi:hypothetical protein